MTDKVEDAQKADNKATTKKHLVMMMVVFFIIIVLLGVTTIFDSFRAVDKGIAGAQAQRAVSDDPSPAGYTSVKDLQDLASMIREEQSALASREQPASSSPRQRPALMPGSDFGRQPQEAQIPAFKGRRHASAGTRSAAPQQHDSSDDGLTREERIAERKNQLLSQLMGGIQGGIPGVANNGSETLVADSQKEYSLIEAPAGHALLPGTVIQIALDTAVNSDYTTANWRGVVTRPVYDLRSGTVLIPAGSAVLGPVLYAGEPGAGLPDRVGVAVDQIVRPDGSIVVLGESGMDHRGVGGISGDVDRHLSTRLAGFAAYAILGVAPALAVQSGEPESTRDLATTRLTSNIQTAGEEIARPYMNRRPTILLYPGDSLSVMLTQTLEFPS